VTFPEIYQRTFSCVNDVSTTIDVSIATVYSGGVLTIFCLFFSFFPFVCKKKIILYLFVYAFINYVS